MIDVRMFTVGPVQENTYIVRAKGSDRAVIFDPGDEAERLLEALDALGIQQLEAILLTHTHFDHVGAVAPVARATGAPVYCPELETQVLANVMEKPASQIFAEFLDKEKEGAPDGGGDVKYHLGYSIDRVFGSDGDAKRVHLSMTFNPSHLEWVNTVVQGRVRAKQDRLGDTGRTRALPILIHGDAAFAGQGIIAEAFNMSELDGYRVGGTVHIVVNNQVGFTTSPSCAKSTTYATDVATMLRAASDAPRT